MAECDALEKGILTKESPDLEFSVAPEELELLGADEDDCMLKESEANSSDSPDLQDCSKFEDPSELLPPGTETPKDSSATSKYVPIVFDLPTNSAEDAEVANSSSGEDPLMPPGEEVGIPKSSITSKSPMMPPGEEVDIPKRSITPNSTLTSKTAAEFRREIEVIQGRRLKGKSGSSTSSSNVDKLGALKTAVPALAPQQPYVIRQNYPSTSYAPAAVPYSVQPSFQSPDALQQYLPSMPVYPNSLPSMPVYPSFVAPQMTPYMVPHYVYPSPSAPYPIVPPNSTYSAVPHPSASSLPASVSTSMPHTHPSYSYVQMQSTPTLPEAVVTSSASTKAVEAEKFLVSVKDVFRYMRAAELKKILNVFGNIKQYKFVPSTSSTHASCEAQMQYAYQAQRAARILSLLIVSGVRMRATASTSLHPNTDAGATMNVDVECMVTIGNFLKSTGRIFKWESSTSCGDASKSSGSADDAAKLLAKTETGVAPLRGNLIKIKLSSTDSVTTPSSTRTSLVTPIRSQINTCKPSTTTTNTTLSSSIRFSIAPRNAISIVGSSTTSSVFTTRVASSEAKTVSSPKKRPSHQDILKSVQTINKQMNDRQSRINQELERVLKSVDLPGENAQMNSGDEFDTSLQEYVVSIKWGTSKLASTTFNQIAELLRAHIVQRSGGCELVMGDQRVASALVRHLEGRRILDTKLEAALVSNLCENPDLRDTSLDSLLGELDVELDRHNCDVQRELRRRADLALDVYTYKLERCTTQCNSPHCHDYHSDADRRRDPRHVKYRPEYCGDGARCRAGMLCPLAHSRQEVTAHPSVFRSSVCVAACAASTSVCCLAHPSTAEVLFHSSWRDLYVTGLRNTFSFFTGAIRNLFKKRHASRELSVLLVTPHSCVADAAVAVAAGVAQRHGLQLAAVCSGDEDIDGCSAVAGTVHGLLKVLERRKDGLPSLLALIVDDFPVIEEDADLLDSFACLVAILARPNDDLCSGVNKVVVSHQCVEDQVDVANSLLSAEMKVLHYVPEIEQLTVAPGKISRPVILKSSAEPKKEGRSLGKDCKSAVLVDANIKSLELCETQKTQVVFPCKRKVEEKEILSTNDQKLHFTSLPKRLRKDTAGVSKRAASPGEEKEAIGLTPQQFLVEERQLKLEVEEEYKVFLDMPEMHPDYEDILESFSTKHSRQPGGEDDDVWVRFWAEKMYFLQEQTWLERRDDLIEKYKLGSLQCKKSKFVTDSLQDSKAEVEEKSVPFCVRDALDALDSVTDELGVLGPPLRRLIRCARDAGSSSYKAMQFFTSRDNAALLRMCIGKLTKMGVLAPKSKEVLLARTASLAEKLLFHSEEYDKKYEIARKNIIDLDVHSLAKCTEGHTPAEIVKVIRKTLGCENEDFLSKDELQQIYMSISSIHLKMALANDEDDDLYNLSLCRRVEIGSSKNSTAEHRVGSGSLVKKSEQQFETPKPVIKQASEYVKSKINVSPLAEPQEGRLKFRIGKACDRSSTHSSYKNNEELNRPELGLEFSPVPVFDIDSNSHENLFRSPKANYTPENLSSSGSRVELQSSQTSGVFLKDQKSNHLQKSENKVSQSDLQTSWCRNLNIKSVDTHKYYSSDSINSRSNRGEKCNLKGELQVNDVTEKNNLGRSAENNHSFLRSLSETLENELEGSRSEHEWKGRVNVPSYRSHAKRATRSPPSSEHSKSPSTRTPYTVTSSLPSFRASNSRSSISLSEQNVPNYPERNRTVYSEEPRQCKELQKGIYKHHDHRPFHLMDQSPQETDRCRNGSKVTEREVSNFSTSRSTKENEIRDGNKPETASQVKISVIPSPEFSSHRFRNSRSHYRTPSPQTPQAMAESDSISNFALSHSSNRSLQSTQNSALKIRSASLSSTGNEQTDTWFVFEVRQALMRPNLTINAFNLSLCDIFTRKPSEYVLSHKDRLLAEGLQELTNFDLTETMFACALKKLLDDVS